MTERGTKDEARGTRHAGRIKIPFLDIYIVRGKALRKRKKRFTDLEWEFRKQLFTSEVRLKMNTKLRDRINVMLGNVRAPECPKCGKPKTAGGIQWLDHAECCRPKKKEPEVFTTDPN